MSDFEKVKEAADLKAYAEAHLDHVRDGLKCPNCGSGTGKSKTPAFSIKKGGKQWKCFSCDAGGDVFDLAGLIHGTTSKAEQLRHVAEWAGVTLENDRGTSGGGFKAKRDAQRAKERATETRKEEKATSTPENDYTAGRERHRRYIAECAARLRDEPTDEILSYLSARGITHAEAVTLGIGYDPKPANGWKDENGQRHNTPRLVLPWAGCDYYHIDRAIDSRAKDGKYNKPKSDEVGAQPLYNPSALDRDYVVVVEGVLDAIAVQLCGYNAIALGGTAVNDLATEAASRNYGGVVIDMLDADGEAPTDGAKGTKGRGAGAELVSLLGEAGITTLSRAEYDVDENDDYNGAKDAGELFATNRGILAQMLEYMRASAEDKARTAKDTKYREMLKSLKLQDPVTIARDIEAIRTDERAIPTGFKSLDGILNGGLRSGLSVFGAVSSAGKTTLLNQMGDYIAASGTPVLFVSIEQSGRELISKSLSRMMAGRGYKGVDYYDLIGGNRPFQDMLKETALSEIVDEYNETIAPNLLVMSAVEQPTVNDVKIAAYAMAEKHGAPPVVLLDYLQLLKPANEHDIERKAVDNNISELRRLASGGAGLGTPVITISSLNRGSYGGVIEMDSFKESGGVEYGADVLLGLQPRGMREAVTRKTDEGKFPTEALMKYRGREIVDDFRRQAVRECELTVMKNRNGKLPSEPLFLTFYAASSLFVYDE